MDPCALSLRIKQYYRALLAECSQPLGATAPVIDDGPGATPEYRPDCTGDQPQSGAGVPKTRSRLSSRSSQDIEAFPPPSAIPGEQLRTQPSWLSRLTADTVAHVINPSLARNEPQEFMFPSKQQRQRSGACAAAAPHVASGGVGAAALVLLEDVEPAPVLVHPHYSAASRAVLTHAVKQRGLEIPVPAIEDDLRTALELHRLFLDAIADCKPGEDDLNHPIPGHYIVECGLNGDCFFHALAFLCDVRLPGVEIPEVALKPLATAHKGLREVVVSYLEQHGGSTGMDPFFFNSLRSEVVGTYTVERFINLFEKMSLAEYCAQQRKLHQFNGVPESVIWARMTGRSLVIKTQDADPIIYCANGTAAFGWPAAAAAVQDQAWVLHHQKHHYCALFPEQRIDHDAMILPPADLNKHWAHYKSRSITHGGKSLRMPTLAVFKTPDE